MGDRRPPIDSQNAAVLRWLFLLPFYSFQVQIPSTSDTSDWHSQRTISDLEALLNWRAGTSLTPSSLGLSSCGVGWENCRYNAFLGDGGAVTLQESLL